MAGAAFISLILGNAWFGQEDLPGTNHSLFCDNRGDSLRQRNSLSWGEGVAVSHEQVGDTVVWESSDVLIFGSESVTTPYGT